MNHSRSPISMGLCLLVLYVTVFAQGPDLSLSQGPKKPSAWSLPDISFVATLLGTGNHLPDPMGGSGGTTGHLVLAEAELILQGSIYPGALAHLVLAYHDKEVEIEEGYVSISGILDGLSLKAGRERIDIGRINKLHPHAWSTVAAPLVIEQFLGELKGTGLGISYLMPLPFYVNVDVSGWKMDEPEGGTFAYTGWSATAKVLASLPVGSRGEIQAGASGLLGTSVGSTQTGRSGLISGDLSFKAFPGAYGRIVFQNEIYAYFQDLQGEPRLGFYNQMAVKPGKAWEFTARFDMSQATAPGEASWSQRILGGVTYAFSEATTLRLEYAYRLDQPSHGLALQFIFGVGPHTHPIK